MGNCPQCGGNDLYLREWNYGRSYETGYSDEGREWICRTCGAENTDEEMDAYNCVREEDVSQEVPDEETERGPCLDITAAALERLRAFLTPRQAIELYAHSFIRLAPGSVIGRVRIVTEEKEESIWAAS